MTVQFFGEPWDVPALENAEQVDTPVGEACLECGHPIEAGERGYMRVVWYARNDIRVAPIHRGCDLASVVGHMIGVCGCNGFDDPWDRNVELERMGAFG